MQRQILILALACLVVLLPLRVAAIDRGDGRAVITSVQVPFAGVGCHAAGKPARILTGLPTVPLCPRRPSCPTVPVTPAPG